MELRVNENSSDTCIHNYIYMFIHTDLFADDSRYGNRASGIHQFQIGRFQQLIPQNLNCSTTPSFEHSRDRSRKKPQTLQQANQPLSYGCFKYVFFPRILNLNTSFVPNKETCNKKASDPCWVYSNFYLMICKQLVLLLWLLGWLHTVCMPQERVRLPEKIETEQSNLLRYEQGKKIANLVFEVCLSFSSFKPT